jgi:predicted nucleic acid-binding protein
MPDGMRKTEFLAAVQQMLREDFSDRILAFDSYAAVSYGWIRSSRDDIGRLISVEDAQIAALVHSRGAPLATRNTANFDH